MKNFSKTASALLAAALITAGPAAAYSIIDINTSASGAGVNFSVKDNVAMLSGHVEDSFEKHTLENNAAQLEGVDEVRNLLTVSK